MRIKNSLPTKILSLENMVHKTIGVALNGIKYRILQEIPRFFQGELSLEILNKDIWETVIS